MKVNVIFEFAKVYDVSRIDVVKGQKFTLEADGAGRYLSDNDPVLSLNVKDKTVGVTADNVGTSAIWIVNEKKEIIKELTISVVEQLEPQATSLNLSAE